MPAIYLHIPFCLSKCHYCDFVSAIHQDRLAERYTDALCAEIRMRAQELASLPGADRHWLRAPSIFLGGGTPTTLTVDQLGKILDSTRQNFGWEDGAEITIEANPRTHVFQTPGELAALLEHGVNRLSIGAQSFDDNMLVLIGRDHGASEVEHAVKQARREGFKNLSLDLIFALPGQSLRQWEWTLERALALETEHISLYNLTIEEGTVFGERRRQGELEPASSDLEADMYAAAIERLTAAGFVHYEISNFCRPGYPSKHNTAYWKMQDYLGVGVGAHSCIRNVRFSPGRNTLLHVQAVERGAIPEESRESLTKEEALAEAMWLGLRLLDGIDPEDIAARFGIDPRDRYAETIESLISRQLLQWRNGRLALTTEGIFLGNTVFCQFA